MASSGSSSSLGGLSRFGPTQMARLLTLILLLAACWPMCRRRDSSRLRSTRFAADNLPATLREQEHHDDKAAVAHSPPPSLPKAAGSQRLCCAALQGLSASTQGSCTSARKRGVASQLLMSPKAPCPRAFPPNPTPAQQQRAATQRGFFRSPSLRRQVPGLHQLLLKRQPAAHTYAFSSSTLASLLGCSMARIHSS